MTTPTLTLVFTPRELAVLRGRLDYLFGDLEAQWTTATIPADEDTAFRSWHDVGSALTMLDRAAKRSALST